MRVIGRAADQPLLGLEAGAELGVHGGDQLLHLGHGLGADAVAGKQEELRDAMETFGSVNRALLTAASGVQVPRAQRQRSAVTSISIFISGLFSAAHDHRGGRPDVAEMLAEDRKHPVHDRRGR